MRGSTSQDDFAAEVLGWLSDPLLKADFVGEMEANASKPTENGARWLKPPSK